MEGFIVFITEIKLYLKNKKESFIEKWYDFEYDVHLVNCSIKDLYNKHCKKKVDSVKVYFKNFFNDLDDSFGLLYNIIWYRTETRIFGYILSFLISAVSYIILGVLTMFGLPMPFILLSLIPISLIPIDIVVTFFTFVYKRIDRFYNKSLKKIKKEYGVRSDRELVEAYKMKKEATEAKQQVMNQRKTETKKVVRVKNDQSVQNDHMLTDSEFLEKMFGYVSCSKYVSEENREKFLDEINTVLNKYVKLKKTTPGDVNGYLRSDVEHLQSEYSRYVSNQTCNENGFSLRLK